MSFLPRSGRRHRLLLSSSSGAIRCLRRFSPAGAAAKGDSDDLEPIDPRKLPADYDPATFDPAAPPRSPPTERVWRLVDEIAALSLADVAELSCILRLKMGMKEPPAIGIANAGAGGAGASTAGAAAAGKEEAKKQEKTVFELRLDSYEAASKIKVIKEIRGFTDLGLKEAKDLVEKAPTVIKKGLSKEEAEQIIEKMKAVSAKVVME
ncbi:ribosomal protein [Musa troglodytarum]|uniref:Ribosomal protein n=1 Tax=Musa troglodytarum TaxID=320322 RepID=A0A9E7JSR3_9LILI|nr:ribosomal protein [Musa troglodytarum]